MFQNSSLELFTLRVLFIEDLPEYHEMATRALAYPDEGLRDSSGIVRIEVACVSTVEEALIEIARAIEQSRPFDVVVLDLGLPRRKGDRPVSECGIDLLELLMDSYRLAFNALIVQSTYYTDFEIVRQAIRSGAADFLAKPWDEKDLYTAVVVAYAKSREKLARQWSELEKGKRQQWILSQALAQATHDTLSSLSDNLSGVLHSSSAVADTLESQFHYNLKVDKNEPICRDVLELQSQTKSTIDACVKSVPVLVRNPTLKNVSPTELIRSCLDGLHVGLVVKRLQLELFTEATQLIVVFGEELEVIVRELLFNAIDNSPFGSRLAIVVKSIKDGSTVTIIDKGSPLVSNEVLADDNDQTQPLTRSWMLNLLDRAARAIGCELNVSSDEVGNSVQLTIRGL